MSRLRSLGGAVAALRDREADKAEIRRLGIARQLYRDSALRAWAAASAAHQERDTARAELTPMVCGHLPCEMHPQDRACAACHALAEEERGAATIERLRGERDAARAEAERMSADLWAIDPDGRLRRELAEGARPGGGGP